MNAIVKISILLLIAITFCGCISSTKPQLTQEIDQPNSNFILHVSNQSFDKPVVDISISIDGKLLVSDTFQVKNQHYWKKYSLHLSVGNHTLFVQADNSSCKLEKDFYITKKHWAVLSFWYTKENHQSPRLDFEIADEPYGFL